MAIEDIGVLIIFLALLTFALLIFFSNDFYCAIFESADRKMWRMFISNYQDFIFIQEVNGCKMYLSKDKKYCAWIWADESCSIHTFPISRVILCSFDDKMSRAMANKLLSLNNNEL